MQVHKHYLRIGLHASYWILAALFFNLLFLPAEQFGYFSLWLTAFIFPESIAVAYIICYLLIPRYLFGKQYFVFAYLLLATVIVSIWVNIISLALFLIVANLTVVPTVRDFEILLMVNYLIIFFMVVLHFISESYENIMAKQQSEKLKIQTELKLNQANLELLKNQIHPHFLFNTLNNLYGLSLAKSDIAPEMVLKISSLLDYMLYKCNTERVDLRNEIEFLNNYIELERIRSDERLQLQLQLPEIQEAIFVPPLVLFPFVENAFKHSARHNSGLRQITINLTINNKNLIFRVKNNFVSAAPASTASGGLGLENIGQRLKLIYAHNYTLKLNDSHNLFTVLLKLPL